VNILIVGAGSLGMLFAGKLSVQGTAEVNLLTHTQRQAEAIGGEGLTIIEGEREEQAKTPCASFEGTHAAEANWDWVFLTTKQTHLDASLAQYVAGLMQRGDTRLLCFQNGTGHVERLEEAGIARSQTHLAVTTEAAKKLSDNRVAHTGRGTTALGSADPSEDGAKAVRELSAILENAGFRTELAEDINAVILRKLLINSIINPLTAIAGIKNGELLGSDHYIELMAALYDEAYDVLKRSGLKGSREELWESVLQVCRNTAANSSSMLQDLAAGRETEIDWINGSVIRMAREAQRSVPVHETVYRLVKGMEGGPGRTT
jgi:2-dehydropantoate 2-reductase